MKLSDEAGWKLFLENNQDPYGSCILQFAETWANLIEAQMEQGHALEDVANGAAIHADQQFGITGFMYGAAVSILSLCWEHGDRLRRWHNLGTQIGNEGERANETGGTLNPALLNFTGG